MAEPSLDWIVIRNLISGSFILIKDYRIYFNSQNNFDFTQILVKSLEDCSAISHTDESGIVLQISRSFYVVYVLVKSLEDCSAISHTDESGIVLQISRN